MEHWLDEVSAKMAQHYALVAQFQQLSNRRQALARELAGVEMRMEELAKSLPFPFSIEAPKSVDTVPEEKEEVAPPEGLPAAETATVTYRPKGGKIEPKLEDYAKLEGVFKQNPTKNFRNQELAEKTGLTQSRLTKLLARLVKQHKIVKVSTGVYRRAYGTVANDCAEAIIQALKSSGGSLKASELQRHALLAPFSHYSLFSSLHKLMHESHVFKTGSTRDAAYHLA